MAETPLQNAFNDCVERIHAGQSYEECLRLYPSLASELRPMLAAIHLTQLAMPRSQEIAAAKARGMHRLQMALDKGSHFRRGHPMRRLLQVAAAVFISVILSGSGVWAAAQGSIPGDRLYGIKQLSETIQLAISGDDTNLQENFNQRRMDEVGQLLAEGREAEVEFSGIWQAQAESTWIIANLMVETNRETQIALDINLQEWVKIRARTTSDGRIIALQIQPDPRFNNVTIERLATPTTSATNTRPANETPAPTATPSITSSTTPYRTPTATPAPPTTRTTASATACVAQRPDGWTTYTVQSGDTLSQLAERGGITLERLMNVNCLTDPGYVVAGWRLFVPVSLQTDRPLSATDTSIDDNDNHEDDDGDRDDGDDTRDDDRSGSNRGSG
jgi:LysM repeat protein